MQGLRPQALEAPWCSPLELSYCVVNGHMERPFVGSLANTPAKASADSQYQPLIRECVSLPIILILQL